MTSPKLPTGAWTLKDLKAGRFGLRKNGLRVFTTFHCGGGSSMGYRLAGFDVVGGVEIDPEMMRLYRKNLSPNPALSFEMPIQEFKKDMPLGQLEDIDVLDGSPPCSSFSTNGNREKDWGKKKKFREGQATQVLDDLFFHFIDVAKAMRPKVAIAENVKGLMIGNARGYVLEIFEAFRAAGYEVQLFLLNASTMGVPQRRERTFFVARRKDLGLPKVQLEFRENPVGIARACRGAPGGGEPLSKMSLELWKRTLPGDGLNTAHPRGSWFAHRRAHQDRPVATLIAGTPSYHWKEPRYFSDAEVIRAQTFPDDYEFLGQKAQYVCGMSVPPFMMMRVAAEISRQLFGVDTAKAVLGDTIRRRPTKGRDKA